MTLIAAYRAYGIPILMGDFLITRPGSADSLRKKAVKFSENLVVAWTGHLVAARQVLEGLQQRIADTTPTKEQLETYLTAYNAEDFGALGVNLVGWIIDEAQHCFRWRSDYPKAVFYGEPMFDGSGASRCQELIHDHPKGIHSAEDPEAVDLEQALNKALAVATLFMGDEISGGGNRSLGFGHAYEILYLGANGFQYLDDMLYFVWTLRFDENGSLVESNVELPIYKYNESEGCGITEVFSGSDRPSRVDIITPVGVPVRRRPEDLGREWLESIEFAKRPSARARFYCAFVNLVGPNYQGPLFATVVPADVPEEYGLSVQVDEAGNLDLKANPEMLERRYKTIREDQEQTPSTGSSDGP